MNNVAVKNHSTEMAIYDPQLINTLRNSLFPGAKEESVVMAVEYCRHAKLDIMLKPIHIVPMWIVDKETGKGEMRDIIMPGINLYRIQAARSGCSGISEPEFGEDVTECLGGIDVTYPKWCKVTVKRIVAGKMGEWTAKELWKENYANAGKDKATGKMKMEPNAMWSKRPYAQLAKCAEAQALRKAFPEIGAMPTAEEMEGKHLDSDEYEALKEKMPTKGVDKLKSKLGIVKTEEVTTVDFDNETGEILDEVPVKEENEKNSDSLFNTIEFLMESASTVKELMEAMKMAKDLSSEDKRKVSALFNKRQAELKG